MELREQHDAAEAREKADRTDEEPDVVDDSAEAAPAKPKKKKKATTEAKPRKKTTKQVRKRVIWVVYDNSHKPIARFPYTQKKEADEKAEQLKTDKKGTYFVQPLKEEITDE
jgi:hypothetical protein